MPRSDERQAQEASTSQGSTIQLLDSPLLLSIFSHLPPQTVGQLACVQSRWRELIESDQLIWRQFLEKEFYCSTPVCSEGTPLPTYRAAFAQWQRRCNIYAPYFKRSLAVWKGLKDWLGEHSPPVLASLLRGATEMELVMAEADLEHPLPDVLRALYACHNGQLLPFDIAVDGNMEPLESDESRFQGLLGGYSFYDHAVSMRLLPLKRMVTWTLRLRQMRGMAIAGQRVIVGASYDWTKVLVVNTQDGSVWVGPPHKMAVRGCPRGAKGGRDGLLRWMEEYLQRLQSGMFQVQALIPGVAMSRGICLFPARPPLMTEAVTRGVRVRTSCLLAPERCRITSAGPDRFLFAYSVHFELLSLEEQRQLLAADLGNFRRSGTPMSTVQLMARHWIIFGPDGEVEDEVRGEAVVGEYPLLRAGGPEFVYQSCSNCSEPGGWMEGDFTFVEGTIANQVGAPFMVNCPRITFQEPSFVF